MSRNLKGPHRDMVVRAVKALKVTAMYENLNNPAWADELRSIAFDLEKWLGRYVYLNAVDPREPPRTTLYVASATAIPSGDVVPEHTRKEQDS